jgi:aldehyde:ferredoxin oxidoreductase
MQDLTAKKVLLINLKTQECEVKTYKNLYEYIGGVGLGIKLYEMFADKDPVIFAVGPLNGFYPFASKTAVILNNQGSIEDVYFGGNLSMRIRYAGVDAIVLCEAGNSPTLLDIHDTNVRFVDTTEDIGSLGLPGKRASVLLENNKAILNSYFTAPEGFVEKAFADKQIKGLVVTGTELFSVPDFGKYENLYSTILAMKDKVTVDQASYPSCGNCPLGCGKSKLGEIGGNVLIHSLVACQYAEYIYSDIGIIFSCLNTLGYDYKHEDIENLPFLIEETLKKIS